MFHQGTLQDGIAKAVQESKSVVCFVTDDGDESSLWENDWLQDQSIPSSVENQAIALRLEAGSQEAGYLAAFCPVSDTPTIVVIYQGQLLDQLKPGISKNEFTVRLLSSVSRAQATPGPNTVQSTIQQPTLPIPAPPSPQSPSQPTNASSQQTPTSNAAPTQDSSTSPSQKTRRPNEISYAEQQAQRKREAKIERERILRTIENDRRERRERDEQRRREAQALEDAEVEADATGNTRVRPPPERESTYSRSAQSSASSSISARIQVRLTDGSTLRNAFPSTAPLSTVRSWIDAERTDGGHPYTLKQILTPSPSRALSDTDEKESLAELGLSPSAALVIVPAKGAVTAYTSRLAGAGDGGVLDTAQTTVMRLWAWILAVLMRVVAAVRTFLGLDDAPQQPQQQQTTTEGRTAGRAPEKTPGTEKTSTTASSGSAGSGPVDAGSGSGIRIRTLLDQREREGRDKNREFYNGNQLNFEPRGKDDGNDDDHGVA